MVSQIICSSDQNAIKCNCWHWFACWFVVKSGAHCLCLVWIDERSGVMAPLGYAIHSNLTYHILHSQTDFACFSRKKSRTSGKILMLTLLNQQHSLSVMVLNSFLNRLPIPVCWTPSLLLLLKNIASYNTNYKWLSLFRETVPCQFKHSNPSVKLVKKPGLDSNDLKNF